MPVFFFSFWGIEGNVSVFWLKDAVSVSYICFNNCLNYIYKSVLQIFEREFKTYFVNYMNMDIPYSQENNTKYSSIKFIIQKVFVNFDGELAQRTS